MRALGLLLSVSVHVLVVLALWSGGPPPEHQPRPPPEVTLIFKQVEGRHAVPRLLAQQSPAGGGGGGTPAKRRTPPRHRVTAPVATAAPSLPVAMAAPPPIVASLNMDQTLGGPGGGHPGGGPGDGENDAAGERPRPTSATPALLRSMPEVIYPPRALAEELTGVVRLWVTVDAQGAVSRVEVREDPGLGLGEAARAALANARFEPARLDGRPVPTAFEYLYRFELR